MGLVNGDNYTALVSGMNSGGQGKPPRIRYSGSCGRVWEAVDMGPGDDGIYSAVVSGINSGGLMRNEFRGPGEAGDMGRLRDSVPNTPLLPIPL